MKKLLLFGVLALSINAFGQSKKEQIVALNYSIDSLNTVLSTTRDKSSKDIQGLNYEIAQLKSDVSSLESSTTKLTNENEKLKLDMDEMSKKNLELEAELKAMAGRAILNIPDVNFKEYLVGNKEINTNGDDEIQVSEANAFGGEIDCTHSGINDLTGIEAFTALTKLYCGNHHPAAEEVEEERPNKLTSLDVSKNTALNELDCSNIQLTSLDVSKNTALTYLYCPFNDDLTSIDVSKNTALTYLECGFNQLTSLDVSKNTALTELRCFYNQLTSLDVSKNSALTYLDCGGNELTCVKGLNTAQTESDAEKCY